MDATIIILLSLVVTAAQGANEDTYLDPKRCIMRLADLFACYDDLMPQSVYEYAEKVRSARKMYPYSGDGGPALLNKEDCQFHTSRFDSTIAKRRAACLTDFTSPFLPMVNEYFHALLVQESEAVSGAARVARHIIGARGCAEYMS